METVNRIIAASLAEIIYGLHHQHRRCVVVLGWCCFRHGEDGRADGLNDKAFLPVILGLWRDSCSPFRPHSTRAQILVMCHIQQMIAKVGIATGIYDMYHDPNMSGSVLTDCADQKAIKGIKNSEYLASSELTSAIYRIDIGKPQYRVTRSSRYGRVLGKALNMTFPYNRLMRNHSWW